MDLHKFENKPIVFFEPTPHTTDFFEIFIFEKASGTIELNGHSLEVKENTMFFISPFQKKHIDSTATFPLRRSYSYSLILMVAK